MSEEALKKKYELLKQKQLEKQKSNPEAAGQDSSTSSPAAPRLAPVNAQASSLHIGRPKLGKTPESSGDVVVSASSIDRSQIESFKSSAKRSSLQRPDADTPEKRCKYQLPSLPKKEKKAGDESSSASWSMAEDSEKSSGIAHRAGDDRSPGAAFSPPARAQAVVDRKEGFPKSVHDALEKIFQEVSTCPVQRPLFHAAVRDLQAL
jgi:hypothetical protein